MWKEIRSYVWTFFAGCGATVVAWIALANRRKSSPPRDSKIEADIDAAHRETEAVIEEKSPEDIEQVKKSLRDKGYIK